MNITFNQNEELNYEAEIKVDGDFNLHIERVSKGPIYLMQRGTSEGEYSNSAVLDNDDDTLDYDFAALVYPKWIKIVSGSEVVSASVNFNEGGGSGNGSGSGEASCGEYIYLDLRSIDLGSNDSLQYLTIVALSQLTYYNEVIYGVNIKGVVPYGFIAFMGGDIVNIKGVAVDKTCKVTNVQDGSLIGLEEYIIMSVGELYNSIPRITKDEFYNLEA